MSTPSPVSPSASTNVSTATAPALPTSYVNDDLCRLNFSLKIAQKLNEKNFHLWRQQVEPYIYAHNLTEFLVCSHVPL